VQDVLASAGLPVPATCFCFDSATNFDFGNVAEEISTMTSIRCFSATSALARTEKHIIFKRVQGLSYGGFDRQFVNSLCKWVFDLSKQSKMLTHTSSFLTHVAVDLEGSAIQYLIALDFS
jgi:hypothetical protein